ncbi:hypothetical protein HPP92_007233 [Vanilla planifolia]|uniref:Response regulatory domain-containing protein n=1 Tax=Vanilla planifolia TaxID=51239 RepID=A0A835V7L6_VANPL|nr:hypothetical protein HPP92_007233 [Vanilla planifolia]
MALEREAEAEDEVRWEKLPSTPVRVLLVERDDSTRQIIAALLRKCGYGVTAASNGLKAWEILKEKVHDIDLVLTEVELPKISEYANHELDNKEYCEKESDAQSSCTRSDIELESTCTTPNDGA